MQGFVAQMALYDMRGAVNLNFIDGECFNAYKACGEACQHLLPLQDIPLCPRAWSHIGSHL
jgi:hypothetical protein